MPVNVTFDSPLVVTASGSNALDLEFDLSHPAFIVAHNPPGASATQWAVNFVGPVRRHPIADIAHLVLRQMYGNVTAVASDGSSITITKELPTLPVVDPETPVATGQSLTIQADATNGTIFYDVDAGTSTTDHQLLVRGIQPRRQVRPASPPAIRKTDRSSRCASGPARTSTSCG